MRKFSLVLAGIVTVATAAVATPAVASVSNQALRGGSHVRDVSYSTNWSGYALTSSTQGAYTSITGTWKVPTITPTSDDRYSSQWIGIDGDGNSNLIQLGTEADSVGGRAQYSAWWEILPNYAIDIPGITPRPGDTLTASIAKTSTGKYAISLKDVTTGQSYSSTKSYSGQAQSAEWIVEAPTVGGSQSAAAHFSPTPFSGLTVNSANPHLNTSEEIILRANGTNVSTPSAPNSSGNGFTVTYTG